MSSVQVDPDISVVVPAWGDYAGPPLVEALASLRDQDTPARILVVDNASEPPLAGLGDDVAIVRSETRLTVGAARNLGLERVRSRFVLFWDADDLMLPGTLRHLRDRLIADPDAVLAAASILEGDPPRPHRWPRPWTFPLTRYRRLFALSDCVWSLFPTTGSALMLSEAARAHGFGDANSGEDWMLGVSIAFRGRVLLDPRPGRLYRQHSGSLWATQRSRSQLLRHARAVRARVRADEAVPSWAATLLPAIASIQILAVCVAHPLAETVRVIRRGRRSVD
jgi:glycosyltransferase involved in cell wall biosynthesis